MTYLSKGELFDETIYKLAREIYRSRKKVSKESIQSWEETFLKHSGMSLNNYIEYAKSNNLKEKYINVKKV